MSWKGRILGAIIGFIFANILGAVIGFAIGFYTYDKPKNDLLKQKQASDRAFFNNNSRTKEQEGLILSTFRLMGYVARGAGSINIDHIRQAEQKMDEMNLDHAMRQQAKECFNFGKSDAFNLQEEAFKLRAIIGSNNIMLSSILEILVMLALADEVLSAGENERLMNIALSLDVPSYQMERLIQTRLAEINIARFYRQMNEAANRYRHEHTSKSHQQEGAKDAQARQREEYENYQRQRQEQERARQEQESQKRAYHQKHEYKSEIEVAYELLGVTADTPWEEIRRAHKKLMLKYHPDRLAAQGIPPELASVYTKKAQDVQAAFNLIKKHLGKK